MCSLAQAWLSGVIKGGKGLRISSSVFRIHTLEGENLLELPRDHMYGKS